MYAKLIYTVHCVMDNIFSKLFICAQKRSCASIYK